MSPNRRESFREKHFIIEFNSDFNMADEGLMSNQAKSKNMLVLQADIDSMTVRNDSIGRHILPKRWMVPIDRQP